MNSPKSDAHHVMPECTKTNAIRGNSPFAELPTSPYAPCNYGTTTSRYTNSYFEPRDEVKGDIARMVMYLELVYGLKPNNVFKDYSLLLKWHNQDPVDEFEMNRNDVIFSYQNNRNPFIDYPELGNLFF